MKIKLFTLVLVLFALTLFSCKESDDFENLRMKIELGEFTAARTLAASMLETKPDLTPEQQSRISFEMERLNRIEIDFSQSRDEVYNYILKYIPSVKMGDLENWEREKSLEFMTIDGQKRYFRWAGRNLFRIDSSCISIWEETHPPVTDHNKFNLDQHLDEIIQSTEQGNQRYVEPRRIRIQYTLTVDKETIPPGETLRCWIPYPREIPERQENITLIASDPPDYQIADNGRLQRTIYFEKLSHPDTTTRFQVEYEYISYGQYTRIEPQLVVPLTDTTGLSGYLKEEFPHITFTDTLCELSRKIVGDETNPYRIAQKLYAWIDLHIPWASAREYSTIRNISRYCIENGHGDCGIKALTFITLLRFNGIPARWQSGWEFQPPDNSMHDWGMIYFEPYGWLPMDVEYGLRKSEDEQLKWFYLGGMDSYRLIFNDAISQDFEPSKQHFRSETVDSQRGEVEWHGGNLYFDQWDWDIRFSISRLD